MAVNWCWGAITGYNQNPHGEPVKVAPITKEILWEGMRNKHREASKI